ncbi:hypothetical protein CERZMDRAFT_71034 [Cercospora zeae-maydis SCOH1-5]|uniref:Uncharacterized protein n=1 Tax=Cercospora zeae-maydis SCOH1-5 TaxID=717836 RepID=A0A6A6F470_9PEZI|nr:hypothetical protein CERZMDRAFT_71034 [Cercospora zeae-maydis SCOH1-5]
MKIGRGRRNEQWSLGLKLPQWRRKSHEWVGCGNSDFEAMSCAYQHSKALGRKEGIPWAGPICLVQRMSRRGEQQYVQRDVAQCKWYSCVAGSNEQRQTPSLL